MAHRRHTKAIVTQRDGFMLARIESSDRAFEVNFDAIEPAGETLGLYRDDGRVERIGNTATITTITGVNAITTGVCHHRRGARNCLASRAACGVAATATSPPERVAQYATRGNNTTVAGDAAGSTAPNAAAMPRFSGSGASAQSRITLVGVDGPIAASNCPSGVAPWTCGSSVMVGSRPANHAGTACPSS